MSDVDESTKLFDTKFSSSSISALFASLFVVLKDTLGFQIY